MINESSVYICRKCGLIHVRRNGYNAANSALYHCYDCKLYGVMYPKLYCTEEKKEKIMTAYRGYHFLKGQSLIVKIFLS